MTDHSTPSITTWNRLELNARRPDMDDGLEARIHDPMWMLARQWQVGEFKAENAGSPISVMIDANLAPISRFHPVDVGPNSTTAAAAFDPSSEPLETLVESEPVHLHPAPSVAVGAESGMRLLRALKAASLAGYRAALIDEYPLEVGATLDSVDAAAARYLSMMSGRVPDGRSVYARFGPLVETPPASWTWPPGLGVASDEAAELRAVVVSWCEWFATHHHEPAGQTAWHGQRQEYRFSVAAHDGSAESVYRAGDHSGGDLDWDAFDFVPGASLGATATDPGPRDGGQVRTVVPARVTFPGMPAVRWWELEDAKVDLGGTSTGREDLLRMLLIDYTLNYSNDWFIVPMEAAFGTLSRINSLVVTDVFGVETDIPPTRQALGGAGWTMFTETGEDSGLLLPPVLSHSHGGSPIEDVRFVRDEMANMVWAIEQLVESAAGLPMERHEAGLRNGASTGTTDAVESASPGPASADGDGSTLRYRIATTTPAHWIPMLPVDVDGQLMLERGEMLPDDDAGGQVPTNVLGRILANDGADLRVFEEEIPRTGSRVTRSYRYTRWLDGSTHFWVGRRKMPARKGEGRSGLRFDEARGTGS